MRLNQIGLLGLITLGCASASRVGVRRIPLVPPVARIAPPAPDPQRRARLSQMLVVYVVRALRGCYGVFRQQYPEIAGGSILIIGGVDATGHLLGFSVRFTSVLTDMTALRQCLSDRSKFWQFPPAALATEPLVPFRFEIDLEEAPSSTTFPQTAAPERI